MGGVHRGKEKDKLRVVTSDKKITICESRKVGDLGVNGNVNQRFNETARLEIGSDQLDHRFEWNMDEKRSFHSTICGGNPGASQNPPPVYPI